jgi:hypothetical protein
MILPVDLPAAHVSTLSPTFCGADLTHFTTIAEDME